MPGGVFKNFPLKFWITTSHFSVDSILRRRERESESERERDRDRDRDRDREREKKGAASGQLALYVTIQCAQEVLCFP